MRFSALRLRHVAPWGMWNHPRPGIQPVSPAIGRQILYCCTAREAPIYGFLISSLSPWFTHLWVSCYLNSVSRRKWLRHWGWGLYSLCLCMKPDALHMAATQECLLIGWKSSPPRLKWDRAGVPERRNPYVPLNGAGGLGNFLLWESFCPGRLNPLETKRWETRHFIFQAKHVPLGLRPPSDDSNRRGMMGMSRHFPSTVFWNTGTLFQVWSWISLTFYFFYFLK